MASSSSYARVAAAPLFMGRYCGDWGSPGVHGSMVAVSLEKTILSKKRDVMISLTAKYAVRGLQVLAADESGAFMPLDDLARQSGIPAPYLGKIMKKLAASDIIDSRRGPNGGFRFKRVAEPLTLYAVAECLDDPIVSDACFLNRSACNKTSACVFHHQWSRVRRSILNFLRSSEVVEIPQRLVAKNTKK